MAGVLPDCCPRFGLGVAGDGTTDRTSTASTEPQGPLRQTPTIRGSPFDPPAQLTALRAGRPVAVYAAYE
jgi:hypothetical protein